MTRVVLAGHGEWPAALAQSLDLFFALAQFLLLDDLFVTFPGLKAIATLADVHVDRLRAEAVRHNALALFLLTRCDCASVGDITGPSLHGRQVDSGRASHAVIILEVRAVRVERIFKSSPQQLTRSLRACRAVLVVLDLGRFFVLV